MTAPESGTFVATCDLAGHVRGRSVPRSAHDAVLRSGVGWVPANLALTAFGHLAPGNAFGSAGDLRLMPDAATGVDVPTEGISPGMRLYLANQTQPDGQPWECCPRTLLRQALTDFRDSTGLDVVASFEHEFVLHGLPASGPFSLRRHRDAEPFGDDLLHLLSGCGLEPETWLPEYGEQQFEITLAPTGALAAADRAVLLRELVRDLALRRGLRASFAPLQRPDGTGSGVHVHLSFVDAQGEPVLLDPARPGRLSEVGSRFAAGVLRHSDAVLAWTAPSPVSYLRLRPDRWSVGGAFLAERNREALLRICPTSSVGGSDPARQLNLEYRAADACANPWLALAAMLRAGRASFTCSSGYLEPVVWPEEMRAAELAKVPRLPETLEQALQALETDTAAGTWFPDRLVMTYLAVKRDELRSLEGLDDGERVRRVADVY